jgi:hypothetical protein
VLAQAAALGYRFRMSPSIGWLARDLVSVALALPVAHLWIRVIVPILVRPFGIPIRPSFIGGREWREDIQRLPPLSNVRCSFPGASPGAHTDAASADYTVRLLVLLPPARSATTHCLAY